MTAQNNLSEKTKIEAYQLLKYLYKLMPVYNQLKGTYMGINFIINAMGLDVSIIELWAKRENLTNFSKDTYLVRSDEVNANRQVKYLQGKTKVADLYLTSRFDIDILQNSEINFENYNNISPTIVSVINQMRPVTRVLRTLFYLNKYNTDLHFNYFTNIDKCETDISKFTYLWNITQNKLKFKNVFNTVTNNLYSLFVPFIAETATIIDNDNEKPTNKNAFFNLVNLNKKLNKSASTNFKCTIYYKEKTEDTFKEKDFNFIVNKDISITDAENGFYINFLNNNITILQDLFNKNISINEIDLKLKATFNIALGTDLISL